MRKTSGPPSLSYAELQPRMIRRLAIRGLERLTGQPDLRQLYLDNRANPLAGETFWQAAIRRLGLDLQISGQGLNRLPRTGPVVVVANHPFGVLDGLVLSYLVHAVRPDMKIMTNVVLNHVPEVRPFLLPVDFAPTRSARATNLQSRADAHAHLAAGGCVVLFPAGGVATAPRAFGVAEDLPWQPFAAALIEKAEATTLPIWFDGANSRLFQIASQFSQSFRLALIFHEVQRRRNTVVPVAVGDPVPWSALRGLADRKAVTAELHQRTFALGQVTPLALAA
ncbi:MAG: lysophospholipid acyltransferase family protein [Magnetovibrionaceae bacterium]